MDPEQPQGFRNPMMIIIIVGVVALGAYFLFFRNSSGTSGTGAATGGITSGATTIDKGAVQITVTQNPDKQPKPPVKHRKVTHHHHHKPPVKHKK